MAVIITSENIAEVIENATNAVLLGVFEGAPTVDVVALLPAESTTTVAVADSTQVVLPDTFAITAVPAFFYVPVGGPIVAYDGSVTLEEWIAAL